MRAQHRKAAEKGPQGRKGNLPRSRPPNTSARPFPRRGKVLTYDTIAECVKKCQYAVRGEIYLAATERIKSGKEVIFTNVGNPHGLGQKPLTFLRQVSGEAKALAGEEWGLEVDVGVGRRNFTARHGVVLI